MAKTNTGLVEYCKAQKGNPYWYGTYGQTASKSLYTAKKKQYPKYYTAKDFSSQYGKRVHDCAGLIKGYLWSKTPTSKPVYNSKQDYGATGLYNSAKKKGTISSFKKIAGQLVFKGDSKTKTHVGVYIGDGYVIEAKGHAYGVVKSKFSSGGWKYWAQCHLITDDTKKAESSPAENPEPQPEPPKKELTFQVTAKSGLRIRSDAGTSNRIIYCMSYGSKCSSDGATKSIDGELWAHVSQNGKTGWSSKKYLKEI